MPSLPSKNKTFVIAVENYAEAVIKVFCSCPNLHDFCTSFKKYFVHDCRLISQIVCIHEEF